MAVIDKAINHVGIVVRDLGAAAKIAAALGLELGRTKILTDRGIQVAKLNAPNAALEFIAPVTEDSEIQKFLEKRGGGLHHICFTTTDINRAIRRFQDAGIRTIPGSRRKGADGKEVIFFHPRDTGGILIELEAENGGRNED